MYGINDETGTEMVVAAGVMHGGFKYLLVYDVKDIDSDEVEADILKETGQSGGELFYERVTDTGEFDAVAALFGGSGSDYVLKI